MGKEDSGLWKQGHLAMSPHARPALAAPARPGPLTSCSLATQPAWVGVYVLGQQVSAASGEEDRWDWAGRQALGTEVTAC